MPRTFTAQATQAQTIQAPTPGLRWGDYPERDPGTDAPRWQLPDGLLGLRRHRRTLEQVRAQAAAWQARSEPAFTAARHDVQVRLAQHGLSPAGLVPALAWVADAARRALGVEAYDCQLLAALGMLDNRLVEMATGEGKSLAAALAASIGALAGMPVHVLTANDYLVARDAASFRALYERLGLGVATVLATDAPETRRAAYARPVVYVTASELVFDYLRDRCFHGAGRPALQRRVTALTALRSERPLLRGLCMAVIDEADNILVDEAQTPLVLSREGGDGAQRAFLWQAHALAGRLAEGVHYQHLPDERRIVLEDAGREYIAALSAQLQSVWKNTLHREESIVAALTARHVLLRDRDYLVVDGAAGREIRIVDAVSGRVAEGRQWSRGLHALVAIKEGCRVEPELETLAQITFQRFFRRYHRCGGMSGTLREARGELAALYGLRIVRVPLRRPNRRSVEPTRLFADDAARWPAVVERVRRLSAASRPVLIGTDSVAASLALSRHFSQAGLGHAVLNAHDTACEAELVAAAGRAGAITISTNMAGRGTDIRLDRAALLAGGLHVLACQHNASRRHDRQLAGRAGRQGEPGSSEAWMRLDAPGWLAGGRMSLPARMCRKFLRDGEVWLPARWLGWMLSACQRSEEARLERQRRALFRQDGAFERALSFNPDRK